MPRWLDAVLAGVLLVVASPLLLLSAVAIVVTTGDSPIFCQMRVGRHGVPFRLFKLQTMRPEAKDATNRGSTVSVGGDPRITRVGRTLRRWKLDELPQLWNVVRGDMALVGPRPDVPGYADRLEGDDRELLKLAPGITGAASLLLRDEELLLAEVIDPEIFNDEVLYPMKVELALASAADRSTRSDLEIIVRTLLPLRFQPAMRARAEELRSRLLAEQR